MLFYVGFLTENEVVKVTSTLINNNIIHIYRKSLELLELELLSPSSFDMFIELFEHFNKNSI
jgi:hypothetical protein